MTDEPLEGAAQPATVAHTEACRIRMGRGNFSCSCHVENEPEGTGAADAPQPLTPAFHRYTITSEGASRGYFRLVEDTAGAWVTWAEVESWLAARSTASSPKKACCEAAPDRSGRTCDKPKGHDGEHWTCGGKTLMWSTPQRTDAELKDIARNPDPRD